MALCNSSLSVYFPPVSVSPLVGRDLFVLVGIELLVFEIKWNRVCQSRNVNILRTAITNCINNCNCIFTVLGLWDHCRVPAEPFCCGNVRSVTEGAIVTQSAVNATVEENYRTSCKPPIKRRKCNFVAFIRTNVLSRLCVPVASSCCSMSVTPFIRAGSV